MPLVELDDGETYKDRQLKIAKRMVPFRELFPIALAEGEILDDYELSVFKIVGAPHLVEEWGQAGRQPAFMEDKPFKTKFLELGNPVQEGLEFVHSLLQDIYDYDRELYACEYASFKGWEQRSNKGIALGHYDPYMYLARAIGTDPNLNHGSGQLTSCMSLPTFRPLYFYEEVVRKNPGANVGEPFLFKWFDPGRAPGENFSKQNRVYAKAYKHKKAIETRLEGTGSSLTDFDYDCVDAVGKSFKHESYWLGLKRNQGMGRMVLGGPNHFTYEVWAVCQPLQAQMKNLPWYYTGDLKLKLGKAGRLLRGGPGTCLMQGDDASVVSNKGIVNMDASKMDVGVRPREKRLVSWAIYDALQRSRYLWPLMTNYEWKVLVGKTWSTYQTALSALNHLPVLTAQGLYILDGEASVRSGSPSTTIENTCTTNSRVVSCDWSDEETAVQQMETFGSYRPEKQLPLKNTIDLCQNIVSRFRPKIIHGKIARIMEHLYERESPGYPNSGLPLPVMQLATIVSKLSTIADHPFGIQVILFVKERIRELLREIPRFWWFKLVEFIVSTDYRNGRATGEIERKNTALVLKILYDTRIE